MTVDEAYGYLRAGWERDRLAQAYLVVGPVRPAGTELADRLLQRMMCAAAGDRACGRCTACRHVREHVHVDVLWMEAQKKSRVISIEQIRDLQHLIYQTSFSGGWKAGVLSDADRMSAAAANAFLKTLEEPPARCVFLLLTNSPQGLLSTIVSRCQRIGVTGAEEELQAEWLERLFQVLGDRRCGSVVESLARAGSVNGILAEMKALAEAEVNAGAEPEGADEDRETLEARVMARYRQKRSGVLRVMYRWHRDALMLACGAGAENLFYPQCRDALQAAAGAGRRAAIERLSAVSDMYDDLERNLWEGTVLSNGFARLR